MYEQFYGLHEKPFKLTPDPRYLYLSPHHRAALAHLVYGLQEKQGFVVLTGEVGTGKTTLLYTLLEQKDARVKTVFVFYPTISFHDFLLYIVEQFGLPVDKTATTTQCLTQLRQFLLEQQAKGEIAVIIIDEAHNIPVALLEEIRMLSNLETAGSKLLQIALVGQPELQRKLRLQSLRQLRQRIGFAYEMHTLSCAETRTYIEHRCAVAGGNARRLFTRRALKAIHAHSSGIPRLINTLSDRALLIGHAEQRQRINQHLIHRVAHDLKMRPRYSRWLPSLSKVAALLIGGLLLSGAVYAIPSSDRIPQVPVHMHETLLRVQRLFERKPATPTQAPMTLSHDATLPGRASETQALSREPVRPAETHETENKANTLYRDRHVDQPGMPSSPAKQDFPIKRMMKYGENINKHLLDIYGISSENLVNLIKKNNPHIKNINRIKSGEIVVFPEFDNAPDLKMSRG